MNPQRLWHLWCLAELAVQFARGRLEAGFVVRRMCCFRRMLAEQRQDHIFIIDHLPLQSLGRAHCFWALLTLVISRGIIDEHSFLLEHLSFIQLLACLALWILWTA